MNEPSTRKSPGQNECPQLKATSPRFRNPPKLSLHKPHFPQPSLASEEMFFENRGATD
jgi:hypothetical protein